MTSRADILHEAQETLAKKIRFLLHNESITIENLAARLGIGRDFLKDVCHGRAKPTRHVLQKLCSFFNVKADFFGSAVKEIFWEDPTAEGDDGGDEATDFFGSVSKAAEAKADAQPRKRKFDLAELAAHHQALLECLIEKKVISSEVYQSKVESVRKRAKLD